MTLLDKAVRGSESGRPIMALLDLMGQKWVLRILWELREGQFTFREIQSLCDDLSPTSLNKRLAILKEHCLVDKQETSGYSLTPLGKELLEILSPIYSWSNKWAKAVNKANPV